MPPYRPIEERFWEKVDTDTDHPTGCYEWTAGKTRQGYGVFLAWGKPHLAHRIAYHLYFGVDPTNRCVMHACDNPPCCNPTHLTLGTVHDNNKDRHSKGRSRGASHAGENNPQAKITPTMAREIFIRGDAHAKVAREFGLSMQTVFDIRRKRIWSHATEGLTCGYKRRAAR